MAASFILIVNYRTADLVVRCLSALADQVASLRGGKVIVVDNASKDGSPEVLHAAVDGGRWHAWVEVIELPRNGGFAFGNNAAIARARQLDPALESVILLNPDTVPAPDAVEILTSFLRERPDVGIAGPSIENGHGWVEVSAHAEPSPLGELAGSAQIGVLSTWLGRRPAGAAAGQPYPCGWLSGACMAIRREALDAVGGLDEGFFLYFEEVDFCVRARRRGWSSWLVPSARVVHIQGASTGITVGGRRRPAYWYESRRRFFVKRYGVLGLVAADALWVLGRGSLALRRALRLGASNGFDGDPERFAADLLLGDLRALLSGALWRIPRLA